MRAVLTRLRLKLAANRFATHRDDWYEYLADMISDSSGQRTLLRIFQSDAVRYGPRTPRGYLCSLRQGDLYRVIGPHPDKPHELVVEHLASQVHSTFNPARAAKLSVYQPVKAELAAGDWVRVTRNNAELDLVNGARFEVLAVTPTAVTIGGNGRRLILDSTNLPLHLDRAYATTSHSSQGLTCDRAFINAESSSRTTQRDVYYVGISRARHQTEIYTNNAKKLVDAVDRCEVKTAALDIGLETTRSWRPKGKSQLMDIGT
ncbi:hypothetical protein RBI22_05325 [Alcaligenaceae bacterium C4P045]|nr:hypothetical protein [Alcaligenaceae bacterium C4P045]